MKKLLLSTIILLAFSASIMIFEISCKKVVYAASNTTGITQQGKIIYLKQFYGGSTYNGVTKGYDYGEIWTANYDGTSQQKLAISLPTNVVISMTEPKVSPDGKTLFFDAYLTDGKSDISNGWSVYSCNIDGSNVHPVITASGNTAIISAAY